MKPYALSLGAGILVGVIYALLKVRSPAPPIIALVGLFGILIGEQLVPLTRHLLDGGRISSAFLRQHAPHLIGVLPTSSAQTPEPPRHPRSHED